MSGSLHDLVTNLLQLGTGTDHVTLIEKIIRPLVVYVLLVAALKFMGKRVLAQLNAFDLVVLLLISNTVQNAIIGNDTSLSGGLIGGAALLLVNSLLVRLLWRSPDTPLRGEGAEVDLWRFGEAVRQQKLQLAGNPDIKAEPAGDAGEIRYTATFEVVPDFGKIDPSTLKITRPTATIEDADIDTMIER